MDWSRKFFDYKFNSWHNFQKQWNILGTATVQVCVKFPYSSWANLELRTKQRKLRINLIVGKIKINLKSNVNCNVYTIVMINLDF